MASWDEQGGQEAVDPVPPCPYLVRRGQTPDFARRSNILPWQEALANQPKKWRQLTDDAGAPIKTLPDVGAPTGAARPTQAVAPHIVERELQEKQAAAAKADMREIQVFAVFDTLEEQDFKPNGLPRVDLVRTRANMTDLTGTEIKEMWLAYKQNQQN